MILVVAVEAQPKRYRLWWARRLVRKLTGWPVAEGPKCSCGIERLYVIPPGAVYPRGEFMCVCNRIHRKNHSLGNIKDFEYVVYHRPRPA